MTSEHLSCGHDDCTSGEFLLKPDGRIICADDDCYQAFGHWTRGEAATEEQIREDERRKCAAEIRAGARKIDRLLMPMVHTATLDAADVIDPDVKVKAQWASHR